MIRKSAALALLLSTTLALADTSVTINGKAVTLPSTTQNGQVYVNLRALAQALGLRLTYDAATKRYTLGPAGATGNGQLAGGSGVVGQPYALANSDVSPLNFTLRGAEFVATRVNIGQESTVPAADQKLLVLHYSVQNAGKTESRFSWSSVKFTVVDDQNANRQNVEAVGREGSSDAVDLRLKPAQKVDVYTVIPLPAANGAPKLIVQGGDQKVLRYDLHGVVKAMAAPYADPQNPLAVRASVPAKASSYVQVGALDLRLDRLALSDAAIGGTKPSDGHRFLIATFSVRNGSPTEQRLSYNNLQPTLRLASGDKVTWNQTVLKAGSDESLDVRLQPGEEAKARLYFEVPTSDPVTTLSVVQDTSRPVEFDVSGAK
ncbi:DUF4352 domain-containing protein [Deinococcus sp. KSM4-11]|uniref:DUF4352 domain-containing protein n=1 Tax=Deinococcus sp. KSM4-11 TaxID=2568654 RepID=UPI0010A49E6F|nr:DUF4352 domain-containing protein [Deinococcus sp. KSM4-11]THF84302.1 DUF4352 domain-containing protein [Deinococcus sp. KSM4-11]